MSMNARERFLAVMNFEPVDRTLPWDKQENDQSEESD